MQYYLQHFFTPDWKYRDLRPAEASGTSNLHNLGYAQNVITGQVLARIIPLEEAGDSPDPRFILKTPSLPIGPNTCPAPKNPTYLLSAANGYVFYNEGKITVKKLLNVRSDVCFRTGNICFVGDLAVHGAVRAGFEAEGNNVRVMGMVEGGVVRARNNLLVDGGCKGGAGRHCRIIAGHTLQAAFAEKAMLRSAGNILLAKYCFYCDVYAGGNLLVKGVLNGGCVQAYGSVYVAGQVGNTAGKATQIFLGYNPHIMRTLARDDARITELSGIIHHQQIVSGHLPPESNELSHRLTVNSRRREALIVRRDTLWQQLAKDERHAYACRLIVPGKVLPGVEIAIGRAFFPVEKPYHNVEFLLDDRDIIVRQL